MHADIPRMDALAPSPSWGFHVFGMGSALSLQVPAFLWWCEADFAALEMIGDKERKEESALGSYV
jgi:hypothetical protein